MKKIYKEFFLFPDIAVLLVILAASICVQVWHGLTLPAIGLFAFGMLVFMFSEYLSHRFFFHLKALSFHKCILFSALRCCVQEEAVSHCLQNHS